MILATVEGNLVSTMKIPPFHAKRLMVIQPVDLQGRPDGKQVLAVDNVNAGVGDLVLCVNEGSSAQLIFNDKTLPLQMVIVAIVDGIDYKVTQGADAIGAAVISAAHSAGAAQAIQPSAASPAVAPQSGSATPPDTVALASVKPARKKTRIRK